MAFTDAWVETDPDGSVVFVSQLDDSDRVIKKGVRERMEGDPADPDLTGLIETGSWANAPKPRKGTARVYVDTNANILLFGATKREDGRLAVGSDSKRLYHVAAGGVVEIAYISQAAGGIIAAGGLTISAGGLIVTTGGIRMPQGTAAMGTILDATVLLKMQGNATNGSGTTQRGLVVDTTAGNDATNQYSAIMARVNTPVAAVTYAAAHGLLIAPAIKGAGSAITILYGLRVDGVTQGVTNYAIYTNEGLVRLGDACLANADGREAIYANRVDSGGPVLTLDYTDTLQTNVSYLSMRRGTVTQADIGIGVNGEPNIYCKLFNRFSVRDTGNVVFFQVDKGSGAGQVGLNVWDFSAGVIKQVTLGAVDSGGAGTKLLRVPN